MPARRTYGDSSLDNEDSTIPLLRDPTSLDYGDSRDSRPLTGETRNLACRLPGHHGETREAGNEGAAIPGIIPEVYLPWWSRETFTGSILFNTLSILLPAIYMATSKLWVSNLDPKMVVMTDVYAYIHVVVDILNEGFPKVSFLIIADKSSRTVRSRIQLSNTLIFFQLTCALSLTILFFVYAKSFAEIFLPEPVWAASLTYIRIASFSALAYANEIAMGSATRCLDKPEIPLIFSFVKILTNILLDILILSRWRIGASWFTPTVYTQAGIRCFCETCATLCSIGVYLVTSRRMVATEHAQKALTANRNPREYEDYIKTPLRPTWQAFITLARPGLSTFLESGFRNGVYLWLVSEVVKTGMTYATAWGVFNSIRWGILMVPVYALEASSATFVGHRWGAWKTRAHLGVAEGGKVKATVKDLKYITRPAFMASIISLCIQVPLGILLSIYLIRPFAYFISGSEAVSELVTHFWRTIDWCYMIYAITTQVNTIILATKPKMYWYKSFVGVALWDLPWALILQGMVLDEGTAWRWHGSAFGGSIVLGGMLTVGWVSWWWRALREGKMDVWE